MLEIKNLTKEFNNNIVLDNISISFNENRIYGIIGKNGIGKTTLLNAIAGVIKYDGMIKFSNNDQVSYITSIPTLPEYLTSKEILDFAFNHNSMDILKELDIKNEDQSKILKNVSLGTKNKLQFYLAIKSNSKVILLDEPFVNFDNKFKEKCIKELKSLKDRIIIIATHDYDLVKTVCDEVYKLDNKKIIKINKKELLK